MNVASVSDAFRFLKTICVNNFDNAIQNAPQQTVVHSELQC